MATKYEAVAEQLRHTARALKADNVVGDLSFEQSGLKFTASVTRPSRGNSATLALRVTPLLRGPPPAAVPGFDPAQLEPIDLRPETGFDRLGKRLGINREAETGDPVFDRAVYVVTDAPDELVRAVLVEESSRESVQELLALGYDSVTLYDAIWLAQATRCGASTDHVNPVAMRESFTALERLASALPFSGRAPSPPVRTNRSMWVMAAVFLLYLLALPGAALALSAWAPIALGEAAAACFSAGLTAWLPLQLALARLLRGSPDSLTRVLWVAFQTLVGAPFLACAIGLSANGLLDGSPSRQHTTTVISRRTEQGQRGKTLHYVRLSSWRPEGGSIELDVDSATYEALPEGSRAVVSTRDGALGWEWRESIAAAGVRN